MVNFQPTVKVDLTVMPEGALAYPASVTQVVPQVYLAKAQPGKPVAVRVDRSDRSLVWIDWAAV